MVRPDLPPGFDGWQASDPTPQEKSEGVQMALFFLTYSKSNILKCKVIVHPKMRNSAVQNIFLTVFFHNYVLMHNCNPTPIEMNHIGP